MERLEKLLMLWNWLKAKKDGPQPHKGGVLGPFPEDLTEDWPAPPAAQGRTDPMDILVARRKEDGCTKSQLERNREIVLEVTAKITTYLADNTDRLEELGVRVANNLYTSGLNGRTASAFDIRGRKGKVYFLALGTSIHFEITGRHTGARNVKDIMKYYDVPLYISDSASKELAMQILTDIFEVIG